MANTTEVQYAPAWVPEPHHRGTWSILYSCLFTLSICVWSAVHLNIPAKGEPSSCQSWRKTKWVFIAIFAPELVLYSAWQQLYLAQRFRREMQNLCRKHYGLHSVDPRASWEVWLSKALHFFGQKMFGPTDVESDLTRTKASPTTPDLHGGSENGQYSADAEREIASFTLTYGFYVVMGGFVVNTEDMYDLEQAHWHTLTMGGVYQLAKTLPWDDFKRIFKLDERQIKDKSKADSLAKMLVILQVLWAVLNSISRLSLGYVISVLEVHTLVHAACAILMYIFWFRKPLDVRDPIVVNMDAFKDELALLLVRDPGSASWPHARFEFPGLWPGKVGDDDFPSVKDANEAAFLCLDTSRSKARAGKASPKQITYSILSQLPTVAVDIQAGEDGSDVHAGSDDEDSYLARIASDVFTNNVSTKSGSEKDRRPTETNFNASLAPAFESSHAIDMPFEMSQNGVWRTPARLVQESSWKSWARCTGYRNSKPVVTIPTSVTLATGEFLECGIGPASLITLRKDDWFTYSRMGSPTQTLIEVDERLKPLLEVPRPYYQTDLKTSEANPPDPETIYYRKIFASLSAKDVTRWTRAGNAFRAELKSKERTIETMVPKQDLSLARFLNHEASVEPGKDAVAVELETSNTCGSKGKSSQLRSLWKDADPNDFIVLTLGSLCRRSENIDYLTIEQLTWKVGAVQCSRYLIMTYTSSIYAAIHLLLWNHEFPTKVESTLWKISGITLGIWTPFLVLIILIVCIRMLRWPYRVIKDACKEYGVSVPVVCRTWFRHRWSSVSWQTQRLHDVVSKRIKRLCEEWKRKQRASQARNGLLHRMSRTAVGTWQGLLVVFWIMTTAILAGAGALYAFSRVYIVAESFLSLRHVQVGVYEKVTWAQYIPHL